MYASAFERKICNGLKDRELNCCFSDRTAILSKMALFPQRFAYSLGQIDMTSNLKLFRWRGALLSDKSLPLDPILLSQSPF